MNSIPLEETRINLPEPLQNLRTLAYNLWWTWNPEVQALFQRIDPANWAREHNPIRLLVDTPEERLAELAGDAGFCSDLDNLHTHLVEYLTAPAWYQTAEATADRRPVVYLCAEFGLHECLPIYSGGLGVLAGDHTKSASDLGLPFIGIGLLYKNGYFSQEIDATGQQQAIYPDLDFTKVPVQRVLDRNGAVLQVRVPLPDGEVAAQVWLVQVGRSVILLLDTDVPENNDAARRITAQLYGGDRDMRIRQELVLGIGAVRTIRALQIEPAVWHMNEGHVAFSLVERLRETMQEHHLDFPAALEAVKAGTVFTTHTPVPAGNEAFSLPLVDRYLRAYCQRFGLPVHEFLRLGVQTGSRGEKFFSMTVLALRLSCRSNAVSRLHGAVSRRMWAHLWPEVPVPEIPITSITNGVHIRTWMAPEIAALLDQSFGRAWRREGTTTTVWKRLREIDMEKLLATKRLLKEKLVAEVRNRLLQQSRRHGAPQDQLDAIATWLDPQKLTIGFARRFATYKRANLILRDRERLARLVNNPEHPIQLIFAGKAHPADQLGQALIREIWQLCQQPEFLGKIVFLENYDMRLARLLVQGVDLWLNNPRRPQEASGTSGQKVPINGGINFSVLDGWWPEAYDGRNGWKIGQDRDDANPESQDADDAADLLATLENDIIPLYYGRENTAGRTWGEVMKASLVSIVPRFNTNVMVQNYIEQLYRVAMARTAAFDPESIRQQAKRKHLLRTAWELVHFTTVHANIDPASGQVDITAELYLGDIPPEAVTVELYSLIDGDDSDAERLPLQPAADAHPPVLRYHIAATSTKTGQAYRHLRVIPRSDEQVQQHELGLIHWQDLP